MVSRSLYIEPVRWVEVVWWGRCGCQPERSRGGVNGKVLQEVSRTAELPQNIKCLPANRAQRQSLQLFLKALYVVRVLSFTPSPRDKHVIPEMLPYLRFIRDIFDKIPTRWLSYFHVVYWQVATITLKEHNATACIGVWNWSLYHI